MTTLKHARIGTKLALAPLLGIVCLLIVAAIGIRGSLAGTRSLHEINQARMPGLALAAEIERRIAALNNDVNQSLVWEGAGAKAATIAALDKRIAADFKTLADFIEQQQANPVWSVQDKATLKNLAAEFAKFRASAADTLDIKSAGLGAAAGFITRGEKSYGELHRLIGELVQGQQDQTRHVVQEAETMANRNQAATLAALLTAVVLCSGAIWWCSRLIVRPLVQASGIAASVARGDLQSPDVEILHDETGRVLQSLCAVTGSLSRIVEDIKAVAADIDGVSRGLSQGNVHLAARTEQAASALAQSAASLEQLTASVQTSASSAKEADVLAKQAADGAHEGGAVVAAAVRSMEEIHAQSQQIKDIVGVIDGIAFQTNILALNAAVEAARAGESGKGFAVVAQEVRTLAQSSATAARQIRDLIGESVAQIGVGADKVRLAGSAMEKTVGSIQSVAALVREIASASMEQARGIQQISIAVGEMDRFTQENTNLVQQAHASSLALKAQSDRLIAAVSFFRTSSADTPPAHRVEKVAL
jgi:methyl-accepting chemotaxis protein